MENVERIFHVLTLPNCPYMRALFICTSPVDCTTKSESLYLAHKTLQITSGVLYDIKKYVPLFLRVGRVAQSV